MNVGLIGAGRIGRIHAENIARHIARVTITRIADIAADKARDWAKALGITQVSADVREILADPQIGAVLVCSSTDTHADMVVAAAESGKHVFCEKPVDLTVAKVKKTIAAVQKAGVTLQVGFNRRFDHNFRRIRDLVQQGAIGDPHILRITSRDPAPPPAEYVKVSGGIFLDMTIHDFDMARYLAGSDAVEVYAKGAVRVDPAIGNAGDVDTAVVTITFQNGCLGVIDNSRRAAYGYDQRVEVFGSKGVLSCANDTPTSVTLANESGVAGDKPLYFFLERYHQAFLDELNAFFDTVIEGKPSPVGDIDGLKPLLMGFAAKKSLAEGRPVSIAEIDDGRKA